MSVRSGVGKNFKKIPSFRPTQTIVAKSRLGALRVFTPIAGHEGQIGPLQTTDSGSPGRPRSYQLTRVMMMQLPTARVVSAGSLNFGPINVNLALRAPESARGSVRGLLPKVGIPSGTRIPRFYSCNTPLTAVDSGEALATGPRGRQTGSPSSTLDPTEPASPVLGQFGTPVNAAALGKLGD
jgi:hypothetical protein